MRALQFVKGVNITTSQNNTLVENCFTSQYNVYEIYVTGVSLATSQTSQSDLNMRFIDSSDNVISDSEYDYAHRIMRADSGFTEQKDTGSTSFLRAFSESTDNPPETQSANVTVFNPNSSSSYTYIKYQNNSASSGLYIGLKGLGVHKSNETITGFQLLSILSSRPYDTGSIMVYGVS